MKPDLTALDSLTKLLFAIELQPLQGERFQPTGFPSLGAATYESKHGASLLVESPQSLANMLEATCWDQVNNGLKKELAGLSYVRVERRGKYLTSSVLEAHRINSPYILEGSDKTFLNILKDAFQGFAFGPVDRPTLCRVLLKHDIGSLVHGVFLSKKDLAGGRLRVARALSAFIEAEGVRAAISGGVKNDHVHPDRVAGDSKNLFGNIIFTREEFTAEKITLYVNLDLAQIRGYGLGPDVERLLVLLSLYKLRSLLSADIRRRTACNLRTANDAVVATKPADFELPPLDDLIEGLGEAIPKVKAQMTVETVTFNDELKKADEEKPKPEGDENNQDDEQRP
jgi:CRISPR-associated protein Csb1